MRIVERYPLRLKVLRGEGAARALLPARYVLSKVYAFWLAAGPGRRAAGAAHRAATAHTRRAVIVSIGNLEAGGGGKTPFALALAGAIRSRGGRAVVVTRGYRGTLEGSGPCVIADSFSEEPPEGAELITGGSAGPASDAEIAALAGDEVAIYRSRGVPVVMDADRVRGTRIAAAAFEPTHILLDDAFRHAAPAKDVDILLLDACRPFGTGQLLPLGTLRELPAAARRADVVVFTRASEECTGASAGPFVEGKPAFLARHEPVDLLTREGARPLTELAGRDAVLFSGIARPGSFEDLAASLGARPLVAIRFEDHHRYRPSDAEEIMEAGGKGSLYLTTEKDFVKAAALFPAGADVRALRVEMRVSGFERLLEIIRA